MHYAMYTCCPHKGCGAFQKGLKFLKSWGIEPAIEMDERGHYFDFSIPSTWPKKRKKAFKRSLDKQVQYIAPACFQCQGQEHLLNATCHSCHAQFIVCGPCIVESRVTACPSCSHPIVCEKASAETEAGRSGNGPSSTEAASTSEINNSEHTAE